MSGNPEAFSINDAEERAAEIVEALSRNADEDWRAKVFIVAKIAYDLKEAECARCGWRYLTGHKTGRRSHRLYCSDACRVAAYRVRKEMALTP